MIEIPLWLVAVAGLLLVAGSLAMMLLQRRSRPSSAPPLPQEWALTARAVFTTGERRVYRMLKETLPNHVILSKLPLVRFCQPIDLGQLRYWYDMLGTNYVSFAICAPNGRVLAAIDIDKDRSSDANPHLRRSMKIKRSVLRSCRVRYLRTPAGKLPSAAEIHALLPKTGSTPPPAAAPAVADMPPGQEPLQASDTACALPETTAAPAASAGALKAAAAQAAAAQAAAQIAAQQAAAKAAAKPVAAAPSTPVEEPPTAAETAEEAPAVEAFAPSSPAAGEAPSRATPPGRADEAALSRARESLANTVASRRAQRNILWQESSVFQDSFFALDSRLDDEPSTMSGDLDTENRMPFLAEMDQPPAATSEETKPAVVKVTLDDMVPSERLSKLAPADVEEARYASNQS